MSGSDAPALDPWSKINASTAIVLEFPEPEKAWNQLANQSQVWKAFRSQPFVEALHEALACSFSAPQRESAMEQFKEAPLLIALDRVNAKESSVLAILSSAKEINRTKLIDLLGCMDPEMIKDAAKVDENNYIVELDSTMGTMHVRIENNIMLLASDPHLLSLPSGDSSFADLPDVQRVRSTLGKGADAHVVMNTTLAERYFDLFLKPEKQRLMKMPPGMAALDLSIRPSDMLVSGILAAEDTQNIADLGQYGGPNNPERMVSKHASYLYSIHVEDGIEFTQRHINTDVELERRLDVMKDTLLIDMQGALASWIQGEVVIAYEDQDPDQKWVCARAVDGITANQALVNILKAYRSSEAEVRLSDLGEPYLYRFPEALPLEIFGKAFSQINARHVGVINDIVVFAPSERLVRKNISAIVNEKTLDQELRAVVQFEDIANERSTMIWCDLARSRALADEYLDVENARGDTSTLDQLGAVSMLIGDERNGFHQIAMQLQHAPLEQRTEPDVLWRTALTNPVTRKPDVLDDHTSGGRSLLIQDVEGHINYLSGTGELLWSRKLESEIIGGIHQVDRYRNGKLQMLFNTAESIHLIDIKGNDVEGFPIAITANTEAPMALIDYDADRNYRVVVSDLDGKLHNYTIEGEVVKWDPITLSSGTSHALQHVRVKTKDYLLAVENNGTVHLLDRKGQPRYEPSLKMAGISSASDISIEGSLSIAECMAWWSDTTGQVWRGRFGSDPQNMSARMFPSFQHTFQDADGDEQMDILITLRDSILIRSTQTGNTGVALIAPSNSAARIFNFGTGDRRLGISSEDEEGVYLFDLNGTLKDGYPKEGSGAFSISDLNADGKLELIVVNASNEIVAHRCQ